MGGITGARGTPARHGGRSVIMAPVRRPAILAALLALLVCTGTASAKTPTVSDLDVYRDSSGAGRGSLVIVGVADFTGAVAGTRGRVDPTGRGVLTVLVRAKGAELVAHDSVRLSRTHHRGAPVPFRIEIPARHAAVLGNGARVRVSAWLDRVGEGSARRAPTTRGWRQDLCDDMDDDGVPYFVPPCPFLVQQQAAPPAPPVGFEVWRGGTGDSLWQGASEALICVNFWGPSGYQSPNWYTISINTPTSSVGFGFTPPGETTAVPASGVSSYGSSYDTWPTGYANVVTGPTLTATIPTAVLSGPVSPNTPDATLVASDGFPGVSGTWTLSPLPAAAAAGVC